MEDIKNLLVEAAANYNIKINGEQAESFQSYLETLLEWSEKMNLTAIKEPKEVAILHFLDSILPIQSVELQENATCIDVGTGAGFPGVPMKIMRPDLKLTLLDSLNKRLTFLKALSEKIGFDAEILHGRAEEAGHDPKLRMRFDIATARAVAPLNVLCEYCVPFLKIGGSFLAMKGPQLTEELPASQNAIKLLGCELRDVIEYTLPGGDVRKLAVITRVKPLEIIYPRHGSKISKSPL